MMRRKLLLLPLVAVSLTLSHAAAVQSAEPAAASDGKFHLVYLVSTDKVEVGAKAYVEPLFFTDGNRLVFAYDYCRQYYNVTNKPAKPFFTYQDSEQLTPDQIGDDVAPIHRYCSNQSVTFDLRSFVARSNAGTLLHLESVVFESVPSGPGAYPPVMPDSGVARIQNVDGVQPVAPEVVLEGVPQYFFLMTASKVLLHRIAPVRQISQTEKVRLDQRWNKYKKDRVAGRTTRPPANQCENYAPATKAESDFMREHGGRPTTKEPRMVDQSYDDLDGDGVLDLLVRIVETISVNRESASPFERAAVRVFYGNGNEQCVLHSTASTPYSRHSASGPAYVVHLGACSYLVMSLNAYSKSIDLIGLPAGLPGCKNKKVRKEIERVH